MVNARQVSLFIAWHRGSSVPEAPAKYSVCLNISCLRSHLKYTSILSNYPEICIQSLQVTTFKVSSSLAASSNFLSYLPPTPSFLLFSGVSGLCAAGAGSSMTERQVP